MIYNLTVEIIGKHVKKKKKTCSNFDSNDPIRLQVTNNNKLPIMIPSDHNFAHAMACAKLWSDGIIIQKVQSNIYFQGIQVLAPNLLAW